MKSIWPLYAMLFYVFATSQVSAQQDVANATGQERVQRGEAAGRITTLPTDDEGRQRSELLAGHIYLFGKTLDEAIEDLQNSDLKAFAKSYRRMVASYGQLADQIGDASQSLGDASNQVALARRTLDRIEPNTDVPPERKAALVDDISQIRAMLIGKLSAVRARLDDAQGEQRQKLLSQVKGLVERVHQLDRLNGTLHDGSQPLLPGLASDTLGNQLDAIASALEEERKLLRVVSESVRLLVDNTSAEMRRTMRLLRIEAQLPNAQLNQLLETRKSALRMLDDVTTAHQHAANRALDILSPTDLHADIADEDDLLRAVDALIDGVDENRR